MNRNTDSYLARVSILVAITALLLSVLACVTELPRRAPRAPKAESVAEIVVVDAAGAVAAVVQSPDAIDRIVGSWAFAPDDWRAPWLAAPQPAYWIEFHLTEASADAPPISYGLGTAGSAWWLAFGGEEIRFMKALPPVEQEELLLELGISPTPR